MGDRFFLFENEEIRRAAQIDMTIQSMRLEGYHFTQEELDILEEYVDGKITLDEAETKIRGLYFRG